VTNIGDAPTSGNVTVTEVPPPGLTVTALSGPGWACIVATLTCIRADALPPTMSYPDITVTATIALGATGTIANRAVVTGGGDTNPSNGTGTGPIHNRSVSSPGPASMVRDWFDECAARDRAFGFARASFPVG
jgi:hypothetical protein